MNSLAWKLVGITALAWFFANYGGAQADPLVVAPAEVVSNALAHSLALQIADHGILAAAARRAGAEPGRR